MSFLLGCPKCGMQERTNDPHEARNSPYFVKCPACGWSQPDPDAAPVRDTVIRPKKAARPAAQAAKRPARKPAPEKQPDSPPSQPATTTTAPVVDRPSWSWENKERDAF